METMILEQLRKFEPLNETDENTVESIISAMLEGTFLCAPILIWNDGLMTGSHRVVAADMLYDRANEIKNFDDERYEIALDMKIEICDVTDIMEEYRRAYPDDSIDYSYLSRYFQGTWAEEIASLSNEY